MYLGIGVFVHATVKAVDPLKHNKGFSLAGVNLISRQRESLQCRTTHTERKNITTRVNGFD